MVGLTCKACTCNHVVVAWLAQRPVRGGGAVVVEQRRVEVTGTGRRGWRPTGDDYDDDGGGPDVVEQRLVEVARSG